MAFQIYEKAIQRRTAAKEPSARINAKGQLYFNKVAVADLKLHYSHVRLAWDEQREYIGIKGTNGGDKLGARLCKQKEGVAYVSIASFLDDCGIRDAAKDLRAKPFIEGGFVVVPLGKVHPAKKV